MAEDPATARVRIHRELADVERGFKDASRRRVVARNRHDLVGEAQAQEAIEAAFTRRRELLAELADVGCASDAGVGASAP